MCRRRNAGHATAKPVLLRSYLMCNLMYSPAHATGQWWSKVIGDICSRPALSRPGCMHECPPLALLDFVSAAANEVLSHDHGQLTEQSKVPETRTQLGNHGSRMPLQHVLCPRTTCEAIAMLQRLNQAIWHLRTQMPIQSFACRDCRKHAQAKPSEHIDSLCPNPEHPASTRRV